MSVTSVYGDQDRGRVSVGIAVDAPKPPSRKRLLDAFFEIIPKLTLSVIRARGTALMLGPITLLRFGAPIESDDAWSWPIEGGLLARHPGGRLVIGWKDGRLFSDVEDYFPLLPGDLYSRTQLPFHRAITRQFLLQLRGRVPPPGVPAAPATRLTAAAIDIAICAAVASLRGRRGWLRRFSLLAAGYHLALWSGRGVTVGGAVTRNRVVAIDGARVTPIQALLRLLALPFAARRLRAIHDEIAATDVIAT